MSVWESCHITYMVVVSIDVAWVKGKRCIDTSWQPVITDGSVGWTADSD